MSVTFEGLPMLSHLFQKSTQKLEYTSAIAVIISIFAKFASFFFTQPETPELLQGLLHTFTSQCPHTDH